MKLRTCGLFIALGLVSTTSFAQPYDATAAAPPPAVSNGPMPLVWHGSFFTRFELRDGYDELGVSRGRFLEGDATAFRARMSVTTAPISGIGGPDLVLQFTPQASGFLGSSGNTVNDYALGLQEGYLRIQDDGYALDVGRIELNYGDARLIGNLDWHQSARSFDGLRLRVEPGADVVIDAFVTQLGEGLGRTSADHFAGGDTYFYGVYAMLGPAISKRLDFDLYTLGQSFGTDEALADPNTPGATVRRSAASEVTFGARAKHTVKVFDYGVEAGLQVGQRPAVEQPVDVLAYQVDGEIGARPVTQLRLALGGSYASGDDPTTTDKDEGWNELYPTGHKFLGLMDIIGARRNVGEARLGAQLQFTPKVKATSASHLFWRVEGPPPETGFAGGEVDTNLIYQWSKNLSLRGMYAVFAPGATFTAERLAHYVEIQLTANM